MKITVTPDKGEGPVETLDDLAGLILRASEQVRAAGANPTEVRARVRLNLGQTVKHVELSW